MLALLLWACPAVTAVVYGGPVDVELFVCGGMKGRGGGKGGESSGEAGGEVGSGAAVAEAAAVARAA